MVLSPDPEADDPDAVATAYCEQLRDVIATTNPIDGQAVPEPIHRAVAHGDSEAIQLTDAAAILARGDPRLDEDDVRLELLDRLVIGMADGVLDVETLAESPIIERSESELRAILTDAQSITLAEYARLSWAIGQEGA